MSMSTKLVNSISNLHYGNVYFALYFYISVRLLELSTFSFIARTENFIILGIAATNLPIFRNMLIVILRHDFDVKAGLACIMNKLASQKRIKL